MTPHLLRPPVPATSILRAGSLNSMAHRGGIVQYLSCCDWLISRSRTRSRSIHVVACQSVCPFQGRPVSHSVRSPLRPPIRPAADAFVASACGSCEQRCREPGRAALRAHLSWELFFSLRLKPCSPSLAFTALLKLSAARGLGAAGRAERFATLVLVGFSAAGAPGPRRPHPPGFSPAGWVSFPISSTWYVCPSQSASTERHVTRNQTHAVGFPRFPPRVLFCSWPASRASRYI